MTLTEKKNTGSYYTCHAIADYIAKWAVDTSDPRILEPSFGDGIFIDSALSRCAELGNNRPHILGVEVQAEPYDTYMNDHKEITGLHMDFMDYRDENHFSAIIGNPPYVSLKKLTEADREKILQLIHSYGVPMQTSSSLWMPFMIHATELLQKNGKLGFVLPYELTYVRYAFDLWKYLSNNYGKITVCRIYHDFFPDVDVETILFLAEKKGTSTNVVCYNVFNTVTDLLDNNAAHRSKISIDEIVHLRKPFARELLPKPVRRFLDFLKEEKQLTSFVHDCKFKIGYVSGNNKYFHPSAEDIQRFEFRTENLRKTLMNAKQLSANTDIGIETKTISLHSNLFYPTTIGEGEKKYIDYGKAQGIHKGYKCRTRTPWYLTPGLEIPDVILTVFGDVPKLLLNNGAFHISNSLLSGFSKGPSCKELVCRWYNSLTLLSVETSIHSLGGGSLVLIPGETDQLEIISNFPVDKIESTYHKLSTFARTHPTEEVYLYGDHIVLNEIYHFSDETIHEIREALSILRHWRIPEQRRKYVPSPPTAS